MATAVARPADWVSQRELTELSRMLGDSDKLHRQRLDAYERFLSLPIEPDPLYRGYGYFTNVDLSGLDATGAGRAVALPPAPASMVRIVHAHSLSLMRLAAGGE